MPIVAVSLNGERPAMRTVELRTPTLVTGVLCEVWADEGMELCVVERVNSDGSFTVKRLPGPATRDANRSQDSQRRI